MGRDTEGDAPIVGCSLTVATDAAVDLAVVSTRTGLQPTRVVQAGQAGVTPSGHVLPKPAPRSFWCLALDARPTRDAEAVLAELLDLVEPVAAGLRSAVDELGLELWVSLHIHAENGATPDGTISRRSMQRLAALGADLDLDLYPGSAS